MCSKQNGRFTLNVFNMIARIKESKTLTKHLSWECKCKFDEKNVIQIKSRIMKNVGISVKIKKASFVQKRFSIFGFLVLVLVKIGNI